MGDAQLPTTFKRFFPPFASETISVMRNSKFQITERIVRIHFILVDMKFVSNEEIVSLAINFRNFTLTERLNGSPSEHARFCC